MENLAISDEQLKASSQWDNALSVYQGRLHYPRSWSSGTLDLNQWYQIDLLSNYTRVTGVATQGRGNFPQWVTSYKLQYSNNEADFQYYREQGQAEDKVQKNNIVVVYRKVS